MQGDRGLFAGPIEINDAVVEGAGVGAFDTVGRGVVGGSGVGQSAGGHFEEIERESAFLGGHLEDFGEVAISAEENGGAAVACFEERKETSSFVGHVAPFFETMARGENLDRAHDDAELGGLFEFVSEPGPLLCAEHGGFGAGCFDVVLAALGILLLFERAAEVAGVEEDDLDALSLWTEDFGVVDAFGFAGRVVCREAEDVLEDLLGFASLGVFASGVVEAVVVIVPGRKDGDGFREGGKVGLAGELAIFLLENLHVIGVPVNVVAHEKEDVGILFGDGVEDSLVGFRFVAGSTGDPGDGFGCGKEQGKSHHGKNERTDDHGLDVLRESKKARRECVAEIASWSRGG